ncbi:MAG TPA: SDR family NAD(P)-dependent oxidoreductase [Acidimicrobiales bacterium]|nr:SDR family NAD(P)-dependent oxidoreductase [Acidimicrobiales bacterium]
MRVLITGAARAIGAATARVLSDHGCDVVATARDVELLADVPASMRLQLDVTDPASVETCISAAGELDVVVNNAAIAEAGPLERYPIERICGEQVRASKRSARPCTSSSVTSASESIIEPGYIAPGMKSSPRWGLEAPYDELAAQWFGADTKLLGGGGRPAPEVVGETIWTAITTKEPRLRWPVGADAEMILAARRDLDDEQFEAAMRSTLGIDW